MLAMKLLLLTVLAMTMTACGVHVDDEGEDDVDALDSDDGMKREGGAKNELILITEGSYGVELSSTDVTCRREMGKTTVLSFKGPEGTADEGLVIELRVTGDYVAGDALTPDNSGPARHFELLLWTPKPDLYSYRSDDRFARKAEYASLTILKATDYVLEGRVWIQNLPSRPDTPEVALNLRGSFACAAWH